MQHTCTWQDSTSSESQQLHSSSVTTSISQDVTKIQRNKAFPAQQTTCANLTGLGGILSKYMYIPRYRSAFGMRNSRSERGIPTYAAATNHISQAQTPGQSPKKKRKKDQGISTVEWTLSAASSNRPLMLGTLLSIPQQYYRIEMIEVCSRSIEIKLLRKATIVYIRVAARVCTSDFEVFDHPSDS